MATRAREFQVSSFRSHLKRGKHSEYKQEAYLGCHHDKPRAYKMSVETVTCGV